MKRTNFAALDNNNDQSLLTALDAVCDVCGEATAGGLEGKLTGPQWNRLRHFSQAWFAYSLCAVFSGKKTVLACGKVLAGQPVK